MSADLGRDPGRKPHQGSRQRPIIRLAARLEGMITDPVYEGKSMAGMIDLITSREIAKSSNVLYAHLDGQPALNAYAALFTRWRETGSQHLYRNL